MRPGGPFGTALLAAAILLVVAAPAKAASIAGTITDASTHLGIESGVEICAYEALASESEALAGRRCTTPEPGEGGRYVIGGILAGLYKVAFLSEAGSGYLDELYDDVHSWGEAKVVEVLPGAETPGIDAALAEEAKPADPGSTGGGSDSPPATAAPVAALPPVASRPKPLHCRRGFRKKKVKGKLRCVRVHRRPRHRHHSRASQRGAAEGR